MDYSKFDSIIDLVGLQNDIKEAEASAGTGDYAEVPKGLYEVKIDKLTLTESKKGQPMLSVWFKICEGEYKDRLLFMNQVIVQGFQVHIANTFLKSLKTGHEVSFENYKQYGELIDSIYNKIQDDELEFAVEYGERKGYDVFTIKEVFITDDIPF